MPLACPAAHPSPVSFAAFGSLLTLLFSLPVPPPARAQETPPAVPAILRSDPVIAAAPTPLFSEAERARILGYWNQPGRYGIGVRTGEKDGPFVVRLLPEASVWLRSYNGASRPGRAAGPQKRDAPLADTEVGKGWERWVSAKLTYDRWQSQQAADAANLQLGPTGSAALVTAAPPLPGTIPPDLLAAVGNPPPFYTAVLPRRYTVTFEEGQTLIYTDNIAAATSRNPSYRFAQGVISFGTRLRDLPPKDLAGLFAQAGLTPFEQQVVKAVSVLEGGFDSVNTYDTGFVSVGFIQFASLGGGAGSLGAVLKREKETRPDDFETDFRRFGITVDDAGTLVVVDPLTGAELRGPAANIKIIDDKRLIAVFQRAGRSRAFQIAQIQIAKQQYYPADDRVMIPVNGTPQAVKVSDLIRSEAGMATLFDRKVNTGNIRLLGEVVIRFMRERGLSQPVQVLPYERALIPLLKWRTNFLADPSLAQPQ
ncbi:MAG: hypothetical protein H7Z41_07475 [Cytophagales bacterium]|nr:hypothetical protein [Armatimonadota bacterium]